MSDFDYLAEANLTLSNRFHGEKVTLVEMRSRIQRAIDAGNAVDQMKKALFYGKGDDIGLTRALGVTNAIAAPFHIANVPMPLLNADLTATERREVQNAEVLLHAALGKFTEAAEFLEAVFKALNGEAPPDTTNLLEEIGDGFWYDAIALAVLGSDFGTEQRRNIAKLRKRFPNNFTEYDAQNRDLFAEREVLEAAPVGSEQEG